MNLVLRAVTLNEEPISKPLLGRFDERGGTLGRSDDATLTLPDPERLISRVQAQVLFQDNRYWLENVSAVSPILHNARALSTGMRVVLQAGDEIRIVGYVLEAAFEDDPESATLVSNRTVVPRPRPAPVAPRVVAPESPAPKPSPSAAPTPAPVPTSAPASADAGADELWRAFLDGAGVDLSLPGGPTAKQMNGIGEMLRIAVAGLQRLITMRARAKNEMQAEMTLIQARDNNPLKFSPDAVLAMQMLLQPSARGFMSGPDALRDAMTDLQAHQVGMTAGMRSVLDAVLDRLDPTKLEAMPAERSMLDSLSPSRAKARLWDLYTKEYESLRDEARSGSQRLLGEALRQAYEAQVRNLETSYDVTATRDPGQDER